MKVELWDGDVKEYRVPIMRYWTETMESLEEKELEPLMPLQVFKIRKNIESIRNTNKTEEEKERLIEEKLREIVTIYTEVSEKLREMVERGEHVTAHNAVQIMLALQNLSEYLYSKYKGYTEIEKEAIKMGESRWNLSKVLREGEIKRSKETAHEMFIDGENIVKIRKYSKLPDKELAEVLHELPPEIQSKYDFAAL